ncbi:hypothetical protein PTKIN_Ptkin13bG0112100 [Pterospermum kingtungense]
MSWKLQPTTNPRTKKRAYELDLYLIRKHDELLASTLQAGSYKKTLSLVIVDGFAVEITEAQVIQALIAKLSMVEEEILWLERKIDDLKMKLYQEKKQTKEWKMQHSGFDLDLPVEAIDNGPWSVMGYYLNIKRWDVKVSIKEVDFSEVSFLVQVHKLPLEMLSIRNAKVIGSSIGYTQRNCDKEDGSIKVDDMGLGFCPYICAESFRFRIGEGVIRSSNKVNLDLGKRCPIVLRDRNNTNNTSVQIVIEEELTSINLGFRGGDHGECSNVAEKEFVGSNEAINKSVKVAREEVFNRFDKEVFGVGNRSLEDKDEMGGMNIKVSPMKGDVEDDGVIDRGFRRSM